MGVIFYALCFLTKIFADFRHYWIFTNRVFCGIILLAGGQSSIGFPLLHIGVWFLMKCQSYDVTQNRNEQRCAFLISLPPSIGSHEDNEANHIHLLTKKNVKNRKKIIDICFKI